jgi:outer membrane protein assembly factor BamB
MKREVGVGIAGILLLGASAVSALGQVESPGADGGSFSTFKVDQARTGFLPDGPRPPLKLRWKFQSRQGKADIESFFSFSVDDGFSPASVHDGVVYAGGHDGWIYAIDAKSGRKLWEHKTGGHIMTTPQYRNGRVYGGSMDSYFRALDARDGSLVWQVKFGARMWNGLRYSGMRATPVFVDGMIFLGG